MGATQPGESRETAIRRPAARALLLTPSGHTLLFRAANLDDETGKPFWFPPGGGLEGAETFEEAALRELEEETGLAGIILGPCVWLREHTARIGSTWYHVVEQYYIAHVPKPIEIERTRWTDLELQELAECRWWRMDEIADSEDIFVPRRLAALLPPILRGEYPGVPIQTD